MSKSHPIDELFHDKLKGYEMSPPMHLWDAIDEKRRPKGGFWWLKYGLLLVLGLLLLGAVGFYLLQSGPQPEQRVHHFPIPLADTEDKGGESKLGAEKDLAEKKAAQRSDRDLAQSKKTTIFDTHKTGKTTRNDVSTNILTSTPPPLSPQRETQGLTKADVAPEKEQLSAIAPAKERMAGAREQWSAISSLPGAEPALFPATSLKDQNPTWPVFSSNGNGVSYFLEAFGSPGFASQNLTPASENYAFLTDEVQAAQQNQTAVVFGIRLAAVNRKGWSLRTGVHYTQIKESFRFENHFPEIELIYDPGGGEVREDTIYVPSGRILNNNKEYTILDLPLILGYQKRHQRWTFSAQAGPILNLSFQQKGTLINPNRQLISTQSPEGQSAYRRRLGLNWYGSLGVHYEIQPGVHLMLEPYLRWQNRSFTEESFPIQQKYLTGGVSLGVRKLMLR